MAETTTGVHSERKLRVRRVTRLLQLFSLGLLAIGGFLCFLPVVRDLPTGILSLIAGVVGIVGLSFTWHRALVLFTLLTWATTALVVVRLMLLGLNHDANVWSWLVFLCTGIAALPPALLSSAMHLRRVWRPRPLIGEHNAPLVDQQPESAAPVTGAAPSLSPPHVPAMERPVWPPPNASLALGKDLLAAGRVVACAQSGDASNMQPGDVHASARVAAAVWPPPS